MKYVFLDTCVIVDCAFTRKEKSSPKLLERLMERLGDNGVKLLLPEVVQLELEKVLPQTMSAAAESFGAVKKSVQEVAENSLLSHSAEAKLLDAVKDARAELNNDVKDALDLINSISNEPDKCIVLPLVLEDLIAATKMAINGSKPSKSKVNWGLVQEDCLIIAALERFMNDEPGAEMAICSSNTADFAAKASDGKGHTLHEQIAPRLGECRFYSNPVDLMTDETFMCKENAEMADKETLKSSYEATSQAIKTMKQENTDSLEAALRKLAELELPNKHPYAFEHLCSSLRQFDFSDDSIGRPADLVLRNLTGTLELLGKVLAVSRADQIGLIHSALDDVGFDKGNKVVDKDDVE